MKSCLILLLVILVGAVKMPTVSAAGSFAQVTEDCDDLRRYYILSPNVATSAARRLLGDQHRDLEYWNSAETSPEKFVETINEYCETVDGTPFLLNHPAAIHLIDSLRVEFYRSPVRFSDAYMTHLEIASRAVDGSPFLNRNPVLMERLESERAAFFQQPDSFANDRLSQLDQISLRVSSLPFLRGSPSLTAELKRARVNDEEKRRLYSDKRLAELDEISLMVLGEPFRRDGSSLWMIGLAFALVIGVAMAVRSVVTKRNRAPSHRHRVRAPRKENPVLDACLLLGVSPDYDAEELNRAYRSSQKQYHPDKVSHLGEEFRTVAEAKTRALNEAYELLSSRLESRTHVG